ncbi:hypothetical protein ACFVJ8_11200 [Streptomyces yangpuensis]|uniref:hypothetical protein n=1 Tax=Streptomyces yangpuensis TaxID=1648182 RepID=UPI003644891B
MTDLTEEYATPQHVGLPVPMPDRRTTTISNRHATPARVLGAECSVIANSGAFVGDYVGDSARAEIAYARSLGKPVRFTHPEVDSDA